MRGGAIWLLTARVAAYSPTSAESGSPAALVEQKYIPGPGEEKREESVISNLRKDMQLVSVGADGQLETPEVPALDVAAVLEEEDAAEFTHEMKGMLGLDQKAETATQKAEQKMMETAWLELHGITGNITDGVFETCQPGYYTVNQGACIKCDKGKFSANENAQACDECGYDQFAGRVAPREGMSACEPCPKGKYAEPRFDEQGRDSGGSANCFSCPAGKFQDTEGGADCVSCEPGKYSSQTGATKLCTLCEEGKYAPLWGSNTCTKADQGKYVPDKGATDQQLCQVGFAQSGTGKEECKQCNAGKFSDVTGSIQCKLCDAGRYQEDAGKSECNNCATGKFAEGAGKTECKECDKGWFQDETGQVECKVCEPGRFSKSKASNTCNRCDVNEYTATTASTMCSDCPAGKVAPDLGTEECSDCAAGKYRSTKDNECVVCQGGDGADKQTHQPHAGSGSCIECEAGGVSWNDFKQCKYVDAGGNERIEPFLPASL